MRWLLLDEIVRIDRGAEASAVSKVPDEFYSQEALMVEMMAQTGAVLVGAEHDYQKDMIFAKIESAEFDKPQISGAIIKIFVKIDTLHEDGAWLDGWIDDASGHRVASARFLLMNIGELSDSRQEPITFHPRFMEHFKVREKLEGVS